MFYKELESIVTLMSQTSDGQLGEFLLYYPKPSLVAFSETEFLTHDVHDVAKWP